MSPGIDESENFFLRILHSFCLFGPTWILGVLNFYKRWFGLSQKIVSRYCPLKAHKAPYESIARIYRPAFSWKQAQHTRIQSLKTSVFALVFAKSGSIISGTCRLEESSRLQPFTIVNQQNCKQHKQLDANSWLFYSKYYWSCGCIWPKTSNTELNNSKIV